MRHRRWRYVLAQSQRASQTHPQQQQRKLSTSACPQRAPVTLDGAVHLQPLSQRASTRVGHYYLQNPIHAVPHAVVFIDPQSSPLSLGRRPWSETLEERAQVALDCRHSGVRSARALLLLLALWSVQELARRTRRRRKHASRSCHCWRCGAWRLLDWSRRCSASLSGWLCISGLRRA